MSSPSSRRVVVVGGGILGVSTATRLVRAGEAVVLVTARELTSGASGRSLSWLNSAGVRREAYHRLRLAGIDRYRTLAAAQPDRNWLRFDGGLRWANTPAELRTVHEHEVGHGYDSELIRPDQVPPRAPGVDPSAVPPGGAIWNPGEGWVDLPSLSRVLAAEFVQRGGRLVTDAGRCTLLTDSGAVTGVRTGSGEDFRASVTLLAAGAAVPAMGAEVGLDIPDATVPALLVTTVPVRVGLKAVLNTPRASLRPTPAGALAVDSDWTAPHISQTDDGGYQVTRDLAEELLAEASRLLAGHPRLAADRCAIGSKPIPADGEPVLGGVEQVPGLSLAFTHSGATLGLIVAELLTYEITSGRPHPMLADFNVRRFR